METLSAAKIEGVTSFDSMRSPSHRYVISLQDNLVNIQLEERSTKKKWQTGFLSKTDYATRANTLGNATVSDYVTYFQQLVGDSLNEDSDTQRQLTQLHDESVHLELSTTIRVFQSTQRIRYDFNLVPVAVDRLDILESKLNDHQEELERLWDSIHPSQPKHAESVYLYAESSNYQKRTKLLWKPIQTDHFQLTKDKAAIRICKAGLYAFGVVVNHETQEDGYIVLLRSGCVVQQAITGAGHFEGRNVGHQSTSSLLCIARVKKETHIAVACCNAPPQVGASSYLTAVRITK